MQLWLLPDHKELIHRMLMSERKTAEIKFRVTPSEKAAWQARADVEEIGLSELIRRATNSTLEMKESPEDRPEIAWVELTPQEQAQAAEIVDAATARRAAAPQEDVPSDEVGANECDDYARCTAEGCRGCREPITRRTDPAWTFEAQNG